MFQIIHVVHWNAPREGIFSVWRHNFIVLRDVHSQHVYLQAESLPGVLRLRKPPRICPDNILSSADKQRRADSSMTDKNHGKFSSWR